MSFARIVFLILLLVVLFAAVAFAVLNPGQRVDVDLYWRYFADVPLVQSLFIAFVAGGVLAFLYAGMVFIDFQRRIRRLQKDKRRMERELMALRTLPLEESPEPERSRPEPLTGIVGGREA
jgi:uncharacterized integral membrane protein